MKAVVARDDARSVDEVRRLALGLGLECGLADCVTCEGLPRRLAQGDVDLVLVRTTPGTETALTAIRELAPTTTAPLFAFGPVSDAQHVLRANRSGARDYLDEARLGDDLESALGQLRRSGAGSPLGAVVSVLSATPGAGVTTVATNLAFHRAAAEPNRVGLVELGREPSDLAAVLNLKPTHSLVDVLDQWERLDAAFLRPMFLDHEGGVRVLARLPETLRPPACPPAAVRRMIVLLRSLLSFTVVDLGHLHGPEHDEAAGLSDRVVVVVRLDIPSLRQHRRLLTELAERGVGSERVTLVANRYGQRGQVDWKQAEDFLGAKFAEYLPEDPGQLNEAVEEGQPVTRWAPRAKISRRLGRLAEMVAEALRPGAGRNQTVARGGGVSFG